MSAFPKHLAIAPEFRAFLEQEVLPGLPLTAAYAWCGLAELVRDFAPRNQALLAERERLQREINRNNILQRERGRTPSVDEQKTFLHDIGYLRPEPTPFAISVAGVDPELAALAGPQIVVPADNARYALNAANARWGSLYDALYGADAMGTPPPPPGSYDASRGAEVVQWAKAYLDEIFPLRTGAHAQVSRYYVRNSAFVTDISELKDASAFAGYRGDPETPSAILLKKNGLHVELCIDRSHKIGSNDPAGICDVVLESALSAIIDFEDSVAAVDAGDKVAVYRSWLGLMKGALEATFEKNGRLCTRGLAEDRDYFAPNGARFTLRGRALLLARNVGHLMTTPAVSCDGEDIPEGILDAFITALIGRHDIARGANSATGSIYVVKPKMHGPEEAVFTRDLFAACEALAGLKPNTMKIGVMDEERRTSLNLAAVIEAVKERIVFTNTGFLDRTGDEIHTMMELGPVRRKDDMKQAPWLGAYENNNVAVALACGFAGRAQIGKGMWTMPDRMHEMLNQKIAHPEAGATTAWVPSPTAATLHAIHYHRVDVGARQAALRGRAVRREEMLIPPLVTGYCWSESEVADELDSNVQSILGYIVRWIHQGVGCSKVPDLNGVALMEDRATCRISSQIVANWLRWGVIVDRQLDDALERMARKVDRQNVETPGYAPILAPANDMIVLEAARQLIAGVADAASGYTEPALHAARLQYKTRRQGFE